MEYDNFQTIRIEKEEKKKSDRYFGAKSFTHLYNNTAIAFKERCFGYILRQSGSRQSAISHTSGKN